MHGTSFAAVADAEGNLASLCTTVDTEFGCLVFIPEVGIFMNNSMQDFDPRPGRPNSIAPHKMPMFGVPTLVAADDHGGLFAAASSGGYRITTAVLHSLIHIVDFKMGLQEAVDHPRVDCVGDETFIDARIPDDVREELAARGHSVVVEQPTPWTNGFGRVGAVLRDADSGTLHAASAPTWVTSGGVADRPVPEGRANA
jgi:gamma-glutamyltranspeptidase/glutathione hydrolase